MSTTTGVVVGWNDATRTVQSVTDSKGNAYVRAVGPTVLAGALTQSRRSETRAGT